MNCIRRFFGITALLGFGFAMLSAQAVESGLDTPTVFARVSHDETGVPEALQIAINRYRSGAIRVDLIGAVHVGDKGYYAELNQRFRDYDALLFELVAPEGAEQFVNDSNRRGGFISGAQTAMTMALGLAYQLDEIDYTAENFVHADLSPSELSESMADRGESLYVYFWRMFYASVNEAAKDPLGIREWGKVSEVLKSDGGNPLKVTMAYQMINVDMVGGALDGTDGSAVIDARNQRAIDVLGEQIRQGKSRLAVFYGVAHMPDMEERLRSQLDMEFVDTRWVNAWRLTGPAPESELN